MTTDQPESFESAMARLGNPAPVEGLQQPFTHTDEPHGLRARTTERGTEYVCACGKWDGWARGPASTRFVHNQHAEHQREVAAAEARDEQARMRIIEGETQ